MTQPNGVLEARRLVLDLVYIEAGREEVGALLDRAGLAPEVVRRLGDVDAVGHERHDRGRREYTRQQKSSRQLDAAQGQQVCGQGRSEHRADELRQRRKPQQDPGQRYIYELRLAFVRTSL